MHAALKELEAVSRIAAKEGMRELDGE